VRHQSGAASYQSIAPDERDAFLDAPIIPCLPFLEIRQRHEESSNMKSEYPLPEPALIAEGSTSQCGVIPPFADLRSSLPAIPQDIPESVRIHSQWLAITVGGT
jgi:hypothetical protein